LQSLVFVEGVVPQEVKAMIAMAIDVEHGALQDTTALGRVDLKLGATRDDTIESLRISYYVGGNRALFTCAGPAGPLQAESLAF